MPGKNENLTRFKKENKRMFLFFRKYTLKERGIVFATYSQMVEKRIYIHTFRERETEKERKREGMIKRGVSIKFFQNKHIRQIPSNMRYW